MRFFVLVALLAFTSTAFAQKHMIDFNADAFTFGRLSFNNQRDRGSNASETKYHAIYLNYAQTVTDHVQAGAQVNYSKFSYDSGKSESYELLVGGYYNLDSDLKNSIYASVHLGYGTEWKSADQNTYGNKDEYIISKVAVGKRSNIAGNFTYNPEIGFSNKSYTSGDSVVWSQDFQIRFLQFAVFF